MPNFIEYNQKQGMFLTIIPDEILEPEHPARIVDAVIEQLNLKKVYEYYSEEGSETYHPKMMLKSLFYGYQQDIFSCRKLQKGLKYRADFIYLSGAQVPDFRTLNNFRKRHIDILPDLFAQIVVLCRNLGMIDFKNLAIDGQKIQGNANYKKSYNKERLKKAYDRIKKGLEKLLQKEINEEFTEEKKDKRIERLEKQRGKLENLKAVLDIIQDEKAVVNQTDSDAQIMKHKDRKIVPSYNQQSAVDEKYGVTVSVNTATNNDMPDDLFTLVDKAKEITGKEHENILGDCGFCDYGALKKMETERTEEFYVPDRRFETAEHDSGKKGKFDISHFKADKNGNYKCPKEKGMEIKQVISYDDGHTVTIHECRDCENCETKCDCTKGKSRTIAVDSREIYRTKMREKLRSEKGREIYMKRQGIIEPAHGNDQKNRNWKQHHLRGLKKAELEFILIRIGSNLSKIIKYKASQMLAYNQF
jgi:transposase